MKIIFFNVWNGHIKDGLSEFINEQVNDTDVFCLQEATENMKLDNAAAFADYQEFKDRKYITDDDDFWQSVYVKKDVEVVSSGTLLQGEMDKGLAVYVELKTPGGTLFVCNMHGHARPNNKLDSPGRIDASEKLVEFFKDKNTPVIIGGDFNIEMGTRSLEIFTENGYKNLVTEHDIKTTRNRLAWEKYPGNELYHSNHIFINDKVTYDSFEVMDGEISDHLPIILTVTN